MNKDKVVAYFQVNKYPNRKEAVLAANAWMDAFDAMMEGAALMLDFFGVPVEGTYVTKSGNKVHVVFDSPA